QPMLFNQYRPIDLDSPLRDPLILTLNLRRSGSWFTAPSLFRQRKKRKNIGIASTWAAICTIYAAIRFMMGQNKGSNANKRCKTHILYAPHFTLKKM
ncbi:hypothetical protein, partial [Pseudescherichia sp.]|uniref:hypothetical protein n=1 Tax=Pseudescherichia sp. TaxID=2055881 RepID=UPI0028991DDE